MTADRQEYQRKYYKLNKAKRQAYFKEYYKKHKDEIKQRVNEYSDNEEVKKNKGTKGKIRPLTDFFKPKK